jgi:16S rRNA processing protein RimM
MNTALSDLVCIGVITSPHGVRGMVLVKSFTEITSDIVSYRTLIDDKREQILLNFVSETSKGCFISKIQGCNTRDDAEKYRRVKLYITRDHLPQVDDNSYYHVDLLECEVESLNGLHLGTVKGIYNYGAGDILEISDGKEACMVPFHQDAVPVLDLEAKRIKVSDGFICGRS